MIRKKDNKFEYLKNLPVKNDLTGENILVPKSQWIKTLEEIKASKKLVVDNKQIENDNHLKKVAKFNADIDEWNNIINEVNAL